MEFAVSDHFGIGIYGDFTRLGADLTGPARYRDLAFTPERTYTQASTFDQAIGGGLLISFR